MRNEADFSKGAAWVKGDIVPIAEATIGVNDWGVTRSDITYDVVPVWEGGFFRLEDYLDRFEASMASLRLDVGMSRDEMRGALHAMVGRSGLRRSYVAMVASRGVPLTQEPSGASCAGGLFHVPRGVRTRGCERPSCQLPSGAIRVPPVPGCQEPSGAICEPLEPPTHVPSGASV